MWSGVATEALVETAEGALCAIDNGELPDPCGGLRRSAEAMLDEVVRRDTA